MLNPWASEIWRLIALVLLTLLVGLFSGHLLLTALISTTGYLVWHLVHWARLEKWLRKGGASDTPVSSGAWGEIYYHVYRMRKRNRQGKRRLANVISRFRESTAALPDAAVILREPGEIEWFNNAAARLLGLNSPGDIGQRVVNLLRHPAFADYLARGDFSDSLETPSPVSESIILEVNIIPYGGKNQSLLIARDVTRIKKLEKMRKDFVANVSHELRTPLTVLTGTLETLKDADDNETIGSWRRSLEHMHQHNQRMLSIVEDLLMISKLETDNYQLEHGPVSLAAMMNTIEKETQALDNHQHSLSFDVVPELWLKGEEQELHSAFFNLVANAIRYTPDGGNIEVSCRREGGGISVSVKDSGIGIAPPHIQRLTERFYRIDAGRSREVGGTGLGLAIVKHVLDRHGASLEIRSEPGKGSEFICHFPAKSLCNPIDSVSGAT